jgi:hypothetical protein
MQVVVAAVQIMTQAVHLLGVLVVAAMVVDHL